MDTTKSPNQGVFGVRLEMSGGGLSAVLTGEHFRPDELDVAAAVSGPSALEAATTDSSPVYLVRDSVVGLAVRSMDVAARRGSPDCHSGQGGAPCGVCEKCMDEGREAFTRVILGSLELPECDLARRVSDAVASVIGLAWTDAPWNGAMSDGDVEEVFTKMGVCPKKGEEDEPHCDDV